MNQLERYEKQMAEERILVNQRRTYVGKKVLIATSHATWRDAKHIARLAECSVSTARKHLDKFIRNRVVRSLPPPSHLSQQRIYYTINTKDD